MRNNNGETSVNGYNPGLFRFYQCSPVPAGFVIDGSAKLRKRQFGNKTGGKSPLFSPPLPPFSRITSSYFRVPFTYASSLLSESQEQATIAAVSMSCKVNFCRARSALQISMSLCLASPKWLTFSLLLAPAVRVPKTSGTRW